LINLAKIYWGEVDISDYVMSVGDFEQVFSNFDLTIKECECDMIFMDRILVDYPEITKSSNLIIKQDGKKIFLCYITNFKVNNKTHEIEVIATSILDKLSKVTVQSFEADLDSGAIPFTFDYVTGGTIELRLFHVASMMKVLFYNVLGIELILAEDTFTNFGSPDISFEMLVNGGSQKVSKNPTLRDEQNFITVKDLLNFVAQLGYVLYWDYSTECFNMCLLGSSGATPSITDENIYNIKDDIITANKVIVINYSFCSDFSYYINNNAADSVNAGDGRAYGNGSSIDYKEFTNPPNLCFVMGNTFGWNTKTLETPFLSTQRFFYGNLSINTVETPLFNSFIYNGFTFKSQILTCIAINKNGRYFSKLEYVKEVT
jgi:hypothetical protein